MMTFEKRALTAIVATLLFGLPTLIFLGFTFDTDFITEKLWDGIAPVALGSLFASGAFVFLVIAQYVTEDVWAYLDDRRS